MQRRCEVAGERTRDGPLDGDARREPERHAATDQDQPSEQQAEEQASGTQG
jgi:hypothetical protein